MLEFKDSVGIMRSARKKFCALLIVIFGGIYYSYYVNVLQWKEGNILDTGSIINGGNRLQLGAENSESDKINILQTRKRIISPILKLVPREKYCETDAPKDYYDSQMREFQVWQKITVGFEAYSAFLVNRNDVASVEIITRGNTSSEIHCLLWYNNVPWAIQSLAKVHFILTVQSNTTIVYCELPPQDQQTIPVAVSIIHEPCFKPNNILKIIKTQNYPGISVGICLKPLDEHSRLENVIELLERAREYDLERVIVYAFHTNSDVTYALEQYQAEGLVETVRWSKANASETAEEDCLRRSKGVVRFAIVMSLEEVVYPYSSRALAYTLQDLMKKGAGVYKVHQTEYIVERDNKKVSMLTELQTWENLSIIPNFLLIYDLNHEPDRAVFVSPGKIRAFRYREEKRFKKGRKVLYKLKFEKTFKSRFLARVDKFTNGSERKWPIVFKDKSLFLAAFRKSQKRDSVL